MKTNKTLKVLKRTIKILKPPQKMRPSEWAEKHLILPDGAAAGQKLKLYSFQKEMLDIIDDIRYRKVVYKTSAQIAKTTLLNSALFYWMGTDSSNIGIAQSSLAELKQWKSAKIDKTIEQVPVLSELITDKNDKTKANNQQQTELKDGSFLYFMTLGSAKALRGKTLKRIILDEVSAIDQNSPEGNPIRLSEQRATDFGQEAKILISSTPTFSGDAIDVEYQNSDQREYFVKCYHCQHEHTLKWENVKFDWKKNGKRSIPDSSTAKLHCPNCQEEITESQRIKMVSGGCWIAQNPEVTDTAGFFINRLYSPNSTIQAIAKEFELAWYEYNYQTFYNTVLGLHYSDLQEELDDLALENLRDDTFDLSNIPDSVLGIVVGCDQQLDRLEAQVLGFNESELFVLGYRYFYSPNCEIKGAKAYNDLATFCNQKFKTVSGREVPVLKVAVDGGNGRAMQTVHSFCQQYKKFEMIKGSSSTTGDLFKRSTTDGRQFYMLNVHEGKTWVRSLLNNAVAGKTDAPLTIRFAHDLPDDYFDQLTSENLERTGSGVRWKQITGRRNEALDTLVYSLCMMKLALSKLGGQPFKKLREYRSTKRQEIAPDNTPTEQPTETRNKSTKYTKPANKTSIGKSWFG
ncbi:terminase gpA endonuclease subunit [Leclercia sp. GLN_9]|uniref:terminase gpA endonuclease subunit n=1 Tax=Leclercia sp. GLN_9 TaxID=3367184 RepID=UPI00370C808E